MSKNNVFTVEFVRTLGADDRKQVQNINRKNYLDYGQINGEKLMYHEMAVLAKVKDKVIGYALLAKNFMIDSDVHVVQIAVDDEYKRRGVATAIYQFILKRSKGTSFVSASVHVGNKASERFHKKLGFSILGKPDQYGNKFAKMVCANMDFYDSPKETFTFKNSELYK